MAESRPEWLTVDLAVLAAGAIPVPIYPTLSAGAGPLHPRRLRGDHCGRLDPDAARQDPGDPPPAAGTSQAVVVMDAAAAGQSPRSSRSPTLPRAGTRRMQAEWGVARQFRDARARRPARAARDDHLHLGHHRRAEGRDAHPRRAGVEPAGGGARAATSPRATSACRSCRSATPSSGWSPGSTCCAASMSSSPNRSTPSAGTSAWSGRPC